MGKRWPCFLDQVNRIDLLALASRPLRRDAGVYHQRSRDGIVIFVMAASIFSICAYRYKGVNEEVEGIAMYLGVFDMKERLEQMRKLLKEKRRLKELLEQDIEDIERDIVMIENQLEAAERSFFV